MTSEIPPPDIDGVAVVWRENAPPASFPPKLAVWPSSGKDAPAILPQIFAVAVVPRAWSRVPCQGGMRRRSKCMR